MKRYILTISIILMFSTFTTAQERKFKQDPDQFPEPKPSRSRIAKPSNKTEMIQPGTVLDAKLLSTLNTKNAKVGDEVVLKLTKSIEQSGMAKIPKGSRIIGKITQVKPKSGDDKSSSLSIVFDSLQTKQLSTPIDASIIAVTGAAANLNATDLFGANAGTRSTSRASSGGLLGGVGNTAGGIVGSGTSAVGGVVNTTQNTVGAAPSVVGRGLEGVSLANAIGVNSEGSSTLSASKGNIKINKGTKFRLQLNNESQN